MVWIALALAGPAEDYEARARELEAAQAALEVARQRVVDARTALDAARTALVDVEQARLEAAMQAEWVAMLPELAHDSESETRVHAFLDRANSAKVTIGDFEQTVVLRVADAARKWLDTGTAASRSKAADVILTSRGRGMLRCAGREFPFDGKLEFTIEEYQLPAACLITVDGANGVLQVKATGRVTCNRTGDDVACAW